MNEQENPDLSADLQKALAECDRLRKENIRLRQQLEAFQPKEKPKLDCSEVQEEGGINNRSPVDVKIALFRNYFKGRDDVYAVRWTSQTGRSGYSPACAHEWDRTKCDKPKVKCGECPNRALLELTDEVIFNHLSGKAIIGIYPILKNETTWFIAVDFDKHSWHEDARAYLEVCREFEIDALLERSRSGNGCHVWIFFQEATPAIAARKLGSAILTRAMELRHQIGFDSYDRFFPNQDTMPKGGFGNLIALPLQKEAKQNGNSVFVNDLFEPYPDQWSELSQVSKLSVERTSELIAQLAPDGNVTGVRRTLDAENFSDDPWTLPPSGKKDELIIKDALPGKMELVSANLIYVPKHGLPPIALSRIKRLAAFQNPEFYRNQAMRLPTYTKPRIIDCAEDFDKYIGLPRGLLKEVKFFLTANGVAVKVKNECYEGNVLDVQFSGELRPQQAEAVKTLVKSDTGVLAASTAFGKTVAAIWMLAKRNVNTLILVHRQQLLEQWKEQLQLFLGLKAKDIGAIGGGSKSSNGKIDIALIQSLYRKGTVKDLVADYGHVIIDECHHISAFSFEQVLKQAKAKYILGLTATPMRKDGHHPIIILQCGPIRFRTNPKQQVLEQPFSHNVITRNTGYRLPSGVEEQKIQELYALLANNVERNTLIAQNILDSLANNRTPILLSERKEHLEMLYDNLKDRVDNIFMLHGGFGKKQRREIISELREVPEEEPRLILATGRYIGEGFDDAKLDTLFLALPVSWHGTLQQYAGRLHRLHDNKREVLIYDYADIEVPMLRRMYDKRLKGYKRMGYEVNTIQLQF